MSASADKSGPSKEHPGWRKGCGTMAVILGIGTVAMVALLLAGYTVQSLSDKPPDKSEVAEQMESLADVVDDFFGGDSQGDVPSGETAGDAAVDNGSDASEDDSVADAAPDAEGAAAEPEVEPVPEAEGDAEDADEVVDTGGEGDAADGEQPEPEPSADPGEDFVPFEMIVLGLLFKSREYYSTGTVAAGTTDSDPYAFAKSSYPSMNIKLRTMPTDQFPGATPAEGLPVLFQERVADKVSGSGEWVTLTEPFDLDVNGLPATRMVSEYRRDDEKVFCYHATAIRGETRSSFVYGSYGAPCPDRPGLSDEITEIADSVVLSDPGPVCSVGKKPETEPVEYGVGCDYLAVGWVGVDALKDRDYTEIVLGPVTFDEAATFMREHDQPRW